MSETQPNCFECRFHFITHQPTRPYGCRRFGFKGPFLPSRTVFQETGMKCAYYDQIMYYQGWVRIRGYKWFVG